MNFFTLNEKGEVVTKNSYNNSKAKQDEPQPVNTSLQLALISSILMPIADGIATISAIAAIEEEANEKQNQENSDKRLDQMQQQIDKLAKEIAEVKSAKS
ncbi:hypothetical protein ABE021_05025 [Sporosarcina gallistercoris]|uniref:hypothetical protein n=1 Tax=Sporosarcina gallistercoris TaxID=2762245 RepID=UPI003D29D8A0